MAKSYGNIKVNIFESEDNNPLIFASINIYFLHTYIILWIILLPVVTVFCKENPTILSYKY